MVLLIWKCDMDSNRTYNENNYLLERVLNRRIIVCGGRDYNDEEKVDEILSEFVTVGDTVVSGGAKGADTLAFRWSMAQDGVGSEVWKAEWDKHGKAAGPIRNEQMLRSGADLVIAFPGGRGTDHMIKIAKKAGVEVYEVNEH